MVGFRRQALQFATQETGRENSVLEVCTAVYSRCPRLQSTISWLFCHSRPSICSALQSTPSNDFYTSLVQEICVCSAEVIDCTGEMTIVMTVTPTKTLNPKPDLEPGV